MNESILQVIRNQRTLTITPDSSETFSRQIETDRLVLAQALHSIRECICITDLDDAVLFVNDSFLLAHGYTGEEILGKNIRAIRSPENPIRLMSKIRLASLQGGWQGEVVNRRKDGTDFPVLLSTSIIRDNANQPFAVLEVISDLSESKQAERAVRESEQLYRITLQSISDAVMIVNQEGIIETVNDAAATMNYVSSHGLRVGVHLSQLFPSTFSQERLDVVESVIRNKTGRQIEETLTLSGKRVWLSTKINPLLNLDGSCSKTVVVSRDITIEKEREESLRFFSKNILLTQENERKRVARELHDGLAQSLAALRLEVRSIEKGLPDSARALRGKAKSVNASLMALIEETRRIAMNLTPAILQDIGLTAAIKKLTNDISLIPAIHTTFHIIDLDGYFSPDEEIHLYRILQELFTNISRHSHAHNVALTVVDTERAIEFAVSDDGLGFEVAQMLSSATSKKHFGLRGLQERARLLNGDLQIQSASNHGTTITLRIPKTYETKRARPT